jgi:hypothetical protein
MVIRVVIYAVDLDPLCAFFLVAKEVHQLALCVDFVPKCDPGPLLKVTLLILKKI